MKKRRDRIQAVSQRQDRSGRRARQFTLERFWQVLFADGLAHGLRLSVMLGILAAHDTLQFREFADDACQEIGLTEMRSSAAFIQKVRTRRSGIECWCEDGDQFDESLFLLPHRAQLL